MTEGENKMSISINDFADLLKDMVQEELFTGEKRGSVTVKEVNKNNGMILHGLIIQEESTNVYPTIYVEGEYEMYLQGKEIKECVSDIIDCYQKHNPGSISLDFLTDYKQAKVKLSIKLINLKNNKKMLESMPYFIYGDLAVIFVVMVNTSATISVTNDHMKAWNATPEMLLQEVEKNIEAKQPFSIKTMGEMMCEMADFPEEIKEQIMEEEMSRLCKMYVMTNTSKINGAIAMVFPEKIQEHAERTGANYYILPSSIHEILLVEDDGKSSEEDFEIMVRSVNEEQVLPEEVLSDNVYFYDRNSKQLQIAKTKEPLTLKLPA